MAEWRIKKLSLDIVANVSQNLKKHSLEVYFEQISRKSRNMKWMQRMYFQRYVTFFKPE